MQIAKLAKLHTIANVKLANFALQGGGGAAALARGGARHRARRAGRARARPRLS